MPFNNIAVHDGRMARVECGGDLVTIFYLNQVVNSLFHHGEAIRFQVGTPIATAASGRGFKDRNDACLFGDRQGVFGGC